MKKNHQLQNGQIQLKILLEIFTFVPCISFKGSLAILSVCLCLLKTLGFLCCVFFRSQRKNVPGQFVLEFHFTRQFCDAFVLLCLIYVRFYVWLMCGFVCFCFILASRFFVLILVIFVIILLILCCLYV